MGFMATPGWYPAPDGVPDRGSGIATTVMPPGRSAVLCTPYTPVRVQTPFTLVLGNLTIAVSQE